MAFVLLSRKSQDLIQFISMSEDRSQEEILADLERLGLKRNSAKAPAESSQKLLAAREPAPHWAWLFVARGSVWLMAVAALSVGSGWIFKGQLPEPQQIIPSLLGDPKQVETDRGAFSLTHAGSTYEVTPRAEYEIFGVVVSHNNIHSITDSYHDKNSVDVKDLCLVWGKNVQSNNYHQIKFWSAPWTCWFRTQSSDVYGQFQTTQFSNTHIIGADAKLIDAVKSARIGDQIRMRGLLVDYSSASGFQRKTSLVRSDTGNGACEVLFVESFETLKRATPFWYLLFGLGFWLLGAAVVLRALAFVQGRV